MNDTAPDVRDDEDAPLVRYRHPFALVPLWVIERVDSYAAIKVYVALASFASGPMDGERTAYPSVRAIAERAGMTTERVYKHLRVLREQGAITAVSRYRDDGGRSSNDYVLEAVPPEARVPDASGRSAPGHPAAGDQEVRSVPDEAPLVAEQPGKEQTRKEQTRGTELSSRGRAENGGIAAPKLVRIDGRDIAFDTLAEVCGVDPSGNRAREVATALNGSRQRGLIGIRTLAARYVVSVVRAGDLASDGAVEGGEAFERRLADLIEYAAGRYRERFGPDVTLTPLALAKWWTDLWVESRGGAVDAARIAHEELTR